MSARHRAALLLFGLALAGRLSGQDDTARHLIASDVARLSSREWQGRRTGTWGGEAAADWIATQLQRSGLRPGGDNGGYFHRFVFVDAVSFGRESRLATISTTYRSGRDFQPLSCSAPGDAAGEVVFAGYGIVAEGLGRDDFAGLEVSDKVVLLLRHGPDGDEPKSKWAPFVRLHHKVARARERGARAVLVVTGPLTRGGRDGVSPHRSEAYVAEGGIPALGVRRSVAEALLRPSGRSLTTAQQGADGKGRGGGFPCGSRVELRSDVRLHRSEARNVAAFVPGQSTEAEAIVVGAHYDHLGLGVSGSLDPKPEGKLHPGADDNASGVAALLEVARRLAPRARTWPRSVVLASFGGEELGILGSSQFATNPPPAARRMVAMLNLDMVGRLRGRSIDVFGVGTSPVWSGLLRESAKSCGLGVAMHQAIYGPSDHAPFYAVARPVLFFHTGVHTEYHRPSDGPGRLDTAGIARIAALVSDLVERLASTQASVPFAEVGLDEEEARPSR